MPPALAKARAIKPGGRTPGLDERTTRNAEPHHDPKNLLVVRRKTGESAMPPALAKARAIKHCYSWVIQVRSSRAPAAPDFSGWNWVDQTL